MNSKIYKILDLVTIGIGVRPKALITPDKNQLQDKNKGGIVISADFELAWAFRFSKKENDPIKKAEQTREYFPSYLDLFDKYDIPITWATVGHLMLEKCNKGDHHWMHRLPYFPNSHKWLYQSGDWFDSDPYSNYKDDNAWYAPDLIENILKSKVKHEIGCHTFSHIDFSDKYCPPNVAEDEINACIEAAKPWDINLKSIVFPGGTYGNVEVLKKFNFEVYRRNRLEKLVIPYLDEFGLTVTNSTQMIGSINSEWSIDYQVWRLKKMISQAIKTNTVAHFWFHPSDYYVKPVFEIILPMIDSLRNKDKIWVGRMMDLPSLKKI